MNLRKLLSRLSSPQPLSQSSTGEVDAFADSVLFELKAVVGSAIAQALQERESRYMRAILEESYFSLSTLVIRALDAETAREMESFLSANEQVSAQFRLRFFQQVLQPEYRSGRGALVRVPSDLVPTIELDARTLEPSTQDEEFILSLKGRRVRFEARAILEGPLRRQPQAAGTSVQERASAAPDSVGAATAAAPAPGLQAGGFTTPQRPAPADFASGQVLVTIHDRNGLRHHRPGLPLVIGRDGERSARDHGEHVHGIDVQATYISRQQVLVFDVLGEVCCTIPSSASLTCTDGAGRVLLPDTLYRLAAGQSLRLQAGVPTDSLRIPPQRDEPADYPVIELTLAGPQAAGDATPRPRAIP